MIAGCVCGLAGALSKVQAVVFVGVCHTGVCRVVLSVLLRPYPGIRVWPEKCQIDCPVGGGPPPGRNCLSLVRPTVQNTSTSCKAKSHFYLPIPMLTSHHFRLSLGCPIDCPGGPPPEIPLGGSAIIGPCGVRHRGLGDGGMGGCCSVHVHGWHRLCSALFALALPAAVLTPQDHAQQSST